MPDVSVDGAAQLAKLAGAIRQTQPELRKELLADIRRTARPTILAMRTHIRATLPSSGGLAELIASSKIGIRTRTDGEKAGVRILARSPGHDLEQIDGGGVRHPLFGNRARWYVTEVEEDSVSYEVDRSAPLTRQGLVEVMEKHAEKIRQRTS